MLKNNSLPVAILGLLLAMMFSASCTDPCEGLSCGNGSCMEGICECDTGWEGSTCDTLSRTKFLGDWLAGDICNSGSFVYDCSVTEGTAIYEIVFSNLFDLGEPVTAIVTGNTLIIPDQTFGNWTITGTGGIDTAAQSLSVEYLIDMSGGQKESCIATLQVP